MHDNRYHKILRVSALLVALVLVFDGGYISPITKQFSNITLQYLASTATGVHVGVAPNELNVITAELSKKEQELSAREAALRDREIETRNFSSGTDVDYSTYILSTILFILTVLILLNYALDWTRVRAQRYERQNS